MPPIRCVFLALLVPACKADLDWQGSPDPQRAPGDLQEYKDAYHRDLGDRFVARRQLDELLDEAVAVRILYLGDHHQDPVLHSRHLELLRRLQGRGIAIALGLESLGTQDQHAVEEYLRGGTLGTLSRRIRRRWPDSWLDGDDIDSAYYRELLVQARAGRCPVFALEPTPRLPLGDRDRTIAANILRAAQRHPDRLLVVVVGQAHLLGEGRLIERTGLPWLAIGANPPPFLAAASGSVHPAGSLLRTSSGVWFFAEMLDR